MTNYRKIILCETGDGSPVVAICPSTEIVGEGDLISINDGNLVVAQQSEYIDIESVDYKIIDAVTVIYEAEEIYRLRWKREDEND